MQTVKMEHSGVLDSEHVFIKNATDDGLSSMQTSFLATGILFVAVVLLGFIYFLIYNTPASMRALQWSTVQDSAGGGAGGAGGAGGSSATHQRKTQTRFALFKQKGAGSGTGQHTRL